MMKSYTAWCTSYEGEKMSMTRECESKKEFAQLLHDNGYKVSFIALTEKYDEESEKYNARRIAKNRAAKIRRECEREWRERDKKFAEELEKRLAAEEETAEETAEEPAEVQAEETDEEQNEEIDELIADEIEKEFNEQNTAKENTMFFQELVSARDYFIRSAAGYVTGTKYERDINGDFWGARQCEILMSNINRAANNCNASYKLLAEDFEHLAEMFAEISDKYDGNEDERTVSEIIYEYTRYFPELGTKAMYR